MYLQETKNKKFKELKLSKSLHYFSYIEETGVTRITFTMPHSHVTL